MITSEKIRRPIRQSHSPKPYGLIVRGRDGRPRLEQFEDAAAYKERLACLGSSLPDSMSIEEIARLLDP
jgi:hypothetical protein